MHAAQRHGNLFSVAWGALCVAAFLVAAPLIARAFGLQDPAAERYLIHFLWIVPIGYGMQGVCLVVGSSFNATGVPLKAAALSALQMIVLCIPLAYAGSKLFGVEGIFGGMALSNVIAGRIAIAWTRRDGRPRP